ncbi:MAG: hemolysin family protein [Desulfatiglandales bacterium]
MYKLIIVVISVTFLSALCSLLEAILYSLPTRYVEAKAEKGLRVWQVFRDLRREVDKSISAILSLNTLANTFGATFAGSIAISALGEGHLPIFGVVFTCLILVFGEVIPKTGGVLFGRYLCPYVTYLMLAIRYIMWPFVYMISTITRLLTKKAPQEKVTAEEIRVMAKMGTFSGGLDQFQSRVIEGILSLKERRVKDVMTPRTAVFFLPDTLTLKEIKDMEVQWEHTRVPVYRGSLEEIVGMVITKDLFIAIAKGEEKKGIGDFLRPIHFIPEASSLYTALMEFLKRRQHLFVVLDEFGGVSGVVSLEDVLEDILGHEIVDESDVIVDKQKWAMTRARKFLGLR